MSVKFKTDQAKYSEKMEKFKDIFFSLMTWDPEVSTSENRSYQERTDGRTDNGERKRKETMTLLATKNIGF